MARKSKAGVRARETAPAYGAGLPGQPGLPGMDVPSGDVYAVTVAERGRVVLPAAVRERLNIKEGDRVTLRVEPDGTLTLQTAAAFAQSLVGAFKHLAPGRMLSDELVAGRRREAAQEEREMAALLAAPRKRRA